MLKHVLHRFMPFLFTLFISTATTAEELPRQLQFSQGDLSWNLRHMDEFYPVRILEAGKTPTKLENSANPLKVNYTFNGTLFSIADYTHRNNTTGLIIIKNGRILHESYHLGANATSRFTSWSMAKSITATLLGMVREEGLIESFDELVVDYLPELKDTAYKNVTIKQTLQMSSGVVFTEEYDEAEADVWAFIRDWVASGRGNEYLTTRTKQAYLPGEKFNYNTSETQVLGWLITRLTGKSVSQYLEEKIWKPAGMEADAFWLTDAPGGMETAGFGLNARLRDYARFGILHANDGVMSGKRILPKEWVSEATTPSNKTVMNGALYEGSPLGYQYQWWTFSDRSFEAQGVFGQFIFVNREEKLVIATTSAWPEAWILNKEFEFYALVEAIRKNTL